MTALARQHQKIFAIDAPQSQVTTFRSTSGTPVFSKTPDSIQTEEFTAGWLNADNTGNYTPYVEDINGLFLTLSYNTAYLLEKGIPEYSATQIYYQNSYCQYLGQLYRCKVDNTVNYLPTDTTKWDYIHTEEYSTASIGTGESIVATPSGSTFQFKSLVAGTNVTLTPSVEGDAITISASMSGYADFTASSPLSYNGSTGVLTLSQASSSTNGYLSSADWTSFNSKLSSTIFSANNTWTGTNTFNSVATTSFTLNGSALATVAVTGEYGDLLNTPTIPTVNNATLTIQKNSTTIDTFTANASVDKTINIVETIQSASSPLSITSNALSISQANTSTNGYLSSTDWNTFNGKQNAINANNKLNTEYLNVNNDFLPTTDFSYDLGSSQYRWHTLYVGYLKNEVQSASIFIPSDLNGEMSFEVGRLGYDNGSYKFTVGASTKLHIKFAEIKVGANLIPSNTNFNVGDSSNYWANVYANSYYLSQYARLYTQSTYGAALQWQDSNSSTARNLLFINNNIYPYQPDTISLGQNSYKFSNVFSNKFSITNTEYIDANTTLSDIGIHWSSYCVSGYHANFMPSENNKINLGASGYRWIKVFALSGTIDVSDRRTKEYIEPLDNALEKVDSLGIKSFVYKDDPDHIHYGIIAQDELERNPELVYVPENYSEEDNGGELGVISSNVKYLALKAIQELSAKVDKLEKQLKEAK